MGASVADDMIRSYFERWQRLEEEKRTISDDLKELFAEARGNGLDTKALRAVFREQAGDKAAIEEFDAICDLYRASLNAPRAGRARESQSYAEAKGRDADGFPPAIPFHPKPVTDTQELPEEPATQSVDAVSPRVGDEYAGTSSDENPAPHSNPQPAASLGNADSPASTSSPEPGSLSDADVPAFLKPGQRKSIADYRPNCLHPDACGATGLTHCYTCRKAMEAASETEAAA